MVLLFALNMQQPLKEPNLGALLPELATCFLWTSHSAKNPYAQLYLKAVKIESQRTKPSILANSNFPPISRVHQCKLIQISRQFQEFIRVNKFKFPVNFKTHKSKFIDSNQRVPVSHLFTFYHITKFRYTSGFFSPNH